MQDQRGRDLGRGRHQVIGERAGQERTVRRIGVFLVERGTDRMRQAAGDLARHHAGMQHAPAIVHAHVFVDTHRAGVAIDFDATEVEDEAVAQ